MDATTIGFGLAVCSALSWAAFDIARKKTVEGMTATGAVAALNAVQVPILCAMFLAGAFFAPAPGSGAVLEVLLPRWSNPSGTYAWQYAVSLGFNVLANLLFMRAVALSPLSLTIPYLSFTPVFTALIALVVYQTSPSVAGWIGIVLVCAGAFFLNPGEQKTGPLAPLRALVRERGSLYMIGVALLWSVTSLLDQSASGGTSPTFHALTIVAGLALVNGGWRTWSDRGLGWVRDECSGRVALVVVAGVLSLFAYLTQLVAFSLVDVAYVETIKRALGVLISIGVGYAIFGEGDLVRRAVGACVMVAGVALVMLWG